MLTLLHNHPICSVQPRFLKVETPTHLYLFAQNPLPVPSIFSSPAVWTSFTPRLPSAHADPDQLRVRAEKVRCGYSKNAKKAAAPAVVSGASLLAAASAITVSAAPALALVDERMLTEGTRLSLGLSNNLLGWILVGVFGLIWSLYTVYTSTLDEDDESGGLSL